MLENHWDHMPHNPQFHKLFNELSNIIPGRLIRKKRRAKSDRQSNFTENLKEMLKHLNQHESSVRIKTKLKNLQSLISNGDTSDDKVIIKMLSNLLDDIENKKETNSNGEKSTDTFRSAPFSKLGQDCFQDVDHKKLSWDLRKLALSMAKYLEDRMIGSTDSEALLYRTDAMLTQMITLMTHMHRAMLRNWHQTLMVIGNFANFVESADDDLIANGTFFRQFA